jgi:Dolichyl-phosphate-mannose-protein mannosyltransferase
MTSAKYHAARGSQTGLASLSNQRRLLLVMALFLLAGSVRWLMWQDNRYEVARVETVVTWDYKDSARQLLSGNLRAFAGDLNHMAHPPGYALLLAVIFKTFGESDRAIQFVQIIADCAATVFVFLIAAELFSTATVALAGALIAVSPQLGYYSLLLLPDSICVLPLLMAAYFLVRAIKKPRLLSFAFAGALIGVSCWLRANTLLLAPFVACCLPLVMQRGQRLRPAATIVLAALLVIAPITIKNALVFHRFIPLSLGAGQKLLQGIAEYDSGRFNVPKTDLGIMRQEAVIHNRPDYAQVLFGPDGIERDRQRVRRGVSIIASHPFWYAGVMTRRATSFFRVARVPVIASEVPVSNLFNANATPAWSFSPDELLSSGSTSPRASAVIAPDKQSLRISGYETKYGTQFRSHPIAVTPHRDYLLRVPVKLEDGRITLKIINSQSRVLASTNLDLVEGVSFADQPRSDIHLSFVSRDNAQVLFSVENNAPGTGNSIVEVGAVQLFDLGTSSGEWMRYLRLPLRWLQAVFITAVIIPLVLLGLIILVRQKQFSSIVLLALVPAYYLIFQSALHTERRYVAAIQYFLLIFVAVGLAACARLIKELLAQRVVRPASARSAR